MLDNWSRPELIEAKIQTYLRHYLERGIVALRDGGDLPGFAWKAKQKVNSNQWLGPQILSIREAVQRKGKYGVFWDVALTRFKNGESKKRTFLLKAWIS